MDWGTVPQWMTAVIAGGALGAAIWSVGSQREIARKRAAMDFFVKTEMDKHTLVAHKNYTKSVEVMRKHLQQKKPLKTFVNTDAYWSIREYLNLHELMGVGINQGVFDDDVCFDFWHGELRRAYQATEALIRYIQTQPDENKTYIELVKVQACWAARKQVER